MDLAGALDIRPHHRVLPAFYGNVPTGTNLSEEGMRMYGVFGGYTRWAVVFLIIFVLFFLLVPAYTCSTTTTCTPVA
ncbi:hypothetical protein TC41_0470 [Alicyclobacillus acidocaldarius subsp. acidocaldarius Tc-4-1]|uniref:Uncharacterized protein n=3 Tax=Alicyclobacillus TaxID=29330 RepID=F8ICF9_ALIAT|nr:hypothetical protein TC41_0470 [Alicyclobacillus acidocaldarius subsp. acidocaldarius Tc-4-1]